MSELDAALERYADLLLRWNRTINLTAARTRRAVLDEHVADCRALLPHVPAAATRGLDVGAGGGFPGLVVAIARPTLHLVLLEPVQKKRAFLATAARELGLDNVSACAERLEDHDARDYDVAMSRATWQVPDWIARARPYVRSGGVILAMEGRRRFALPADAERHPYQLGEKPRAVIVVRN